MDPAGTALVLAKYCEIADQRVERVERVDKALLRPGDRAPSVRSGGQDALRSPMSQRSGRRVRGSGRTISLTASADVTICSATSITLRWRLRAFRHKVS